MPLRICFFAIEHHSLGSGGGIASYLEAIVPELVRLGHEVHIIAKGKSNRGYSLAAGGTVHEFKGGNLHWYVSKVPLLGKVFALPLRELEWSWGFYRTLRSLKEVEIDLIESPESGNFFTALLEKSIPLVIRLHGSTYSFEKSTTGEASLGARLDRALHRISFRRAKGISAPSLFQKCIFESDMGEDFRATVTPNPCYQDAQVNDHDVNDNHRNIIFFAGRIADVKGVWPLLHAFVRIVADNHEARLVLAGSPHVSIPGTAVESFLVEHHIADKVEFVGHIQRDQIGTYYERCAVYVVPSYYETFCISAVEAMLYGKPVVATCRTALEEIVDDGKTGLLVPPGDAEALAAALARLLGDKALARGMGEAGRQKAVALFGSNVIAQKMVAFYNAVICGPNI